MRRLLALLPITVALATVSDTAGGVAADTEEDCPTHPTDFARSYGNGLWTAKVNGRLTLYGCSSSNDELKPRVFKLGPWSRASKASFDGHVVVWTVRKPGTNADEVWAADVSVGYRWLRGVRPTVGAGSRTDRKISRLHAAGEGAAWVTTRGTVVLALSAPNDFPESVGEATAAAKPAPAVSPSTGLVQGLALPLRPQGRRLVVGRWEAQAGPEFADSLQLKIGQGESDECGGSDPYQVTVEPVKGERVGASWYSWWSSNRAVCR